LAFSSLVGPGYSLVGCVKSTRVSSRLSQI